MEPRVPRRGLLEEQGEEDLDSRHFYTAYVFDRAHERGDDIATLVEHAQQLGYPVRYWWLSEAMKLRGHPDRLIVCVNHPSSGGDAGLALCEALMEHQVGWDGALLWRSAMCSGSALKARRSQVGSAKHHSLL